MAATFADINFLSPQPDRTDDFFGLLKRIATPPRLGPTTPPANAIAKQNQRELNRSGVNTGFGAGATGGAKIEDFMSTPSENATPLAPGGIARIGGNTFTNVQSDIDAARAAGISVAETSPLTGVGSVSAGRGSFGVVPSAAVASLDPALAAQLSAARSAAADRGDFDAVANSYRVNGGTFNGKTQAQVDEDNRMASVLSAINNAKTVSRLNSSTNVLNALLGLQGTRETAAATRANAQGRLGLDLQKLVLDSLSRGATMRKTELESASLEERQRLAAQAKTRGASESEVASILAGRSAGTPTALQNAILPGATEVPVFDPRTNTIRSVPIQRQVSVQTDSKGAYVMENGAKRYLNADELKRIQK